MTQHRHAEMIKAKADNMELVVFINNYGQWEFGDLNNLVDLDALPAFLCLPQYKETCLHWLSGGDIQALDSNWINVHPVEYYPWEDEHDFMCEDAKIRIKPKKDEFSELLEGLTAEKPISDSEKEGLIYKLIESFYGNGILLKFDDIKSECK